MFALDDFIDDVDLLCIEAEGLNRRIVFCHHQQLIVDAGFSFFVRHCRNTNSHIFRRNTLEYGIDILIRNLHSLLGNSYDRDFEKSRHGRFEFGPELRQILLEQAGVVDKGFKLLVVGSSNILPLELREDINKVDRKPELVRIANQCFIGKQFRGNSPDGLGIERIDEHRDGKAKLRWVAKPFKELEEDYSVRAH